MNENITLTITAKNGEDFVEILKKITAPFLTIEEKRSEANLPEMKQPTPPENKVLTPPETKTVAKKKITKKKAETVEEEEPADNTAAFEALDAVEVETVEVGEDITFHDHVKPKALQYARINKPEFVALLKGEFNVAKLNLVDPADYPRLYTRLKQKLGEV